MEEISAAEYQAMISGTTPKKQRGKSGKVLEKDIQSSILEYLKVKGIYCWKSNNTGIKKPNGSFIPVSMLGVADILGVMPDGRFLAVEVKRPGNKPSLYQIEFIENIKANNGIGIIAYGIEDVMAILDNC